MAWYDFLTGAGDTGGSLSLGLGSLDKALLGAGLGAAASSGTTTTTQTANKDPWAPSQDWLRYNLGLGRNLQDQYMQNPFSGAQQNAYNNSAMLGNQARGLLNTIAPQMSSQQFYTRRNPVASVNPYNFNPANFSQGGNVVPPSGLLNATTVTGSKYVPPPAPPAPTATQGGLLSNPTGISSGGSSGGGGQSTGSNLAANGGLGIGDLTDGINSNALSVFKQFAPFSLFAAVGAALANKTLTQAEALKIINGSDDPLGALIAQQGWSPGSTGSATTVTAPTAIPAANPMQQDPATMQQSGQSTTAISNPVPSFTPTQTLDPQQAQQASQPAPAPAPAPVYTPNFAPIQVGTKNGMSTVGYYDTNTGAAYDMSKNALGNYYQPQGGFYQSTPTFFGSSSYGGGGGSSTPANFGLSWGGGMTSGGFGSDASA